MTDESDGKMNPGDRLNKDQWFHGLHDSLDGYSPLANKGPWYMSGYRHGMANRRHLGMADFLVKFVHVSDQNADGLMSDEKALKAMRDLAEAAKDILGSDP